MKYKISQLIIVIVSILILSSCNSPSTSSIPDVMITNAPTATTIPTNHFISKVYNSYKDAFLLLGSDITISNRVINNVIKIDDFDLHFYTNNSSDTDMLNKWVINFNLDDISKLKELYAATFLVTNSNYTVDTASEAAQKLANSFSTVSMSDTFESGDYYVYTYASYDEIFNKWSYYLCVSDKYTFNIMPIEKKKEYHLSDYSTVVNGIMNNGFKVYFNGTVKTMTLDNIRSSGQTFIVIDSEGNEYKVITSFYSTPHIFDVNETYTFYGTVSGDDTISPAEIKLDYFE